MRLSGEDSDTLEHERGWNGHSQTCLEAATAEQPVTRFVRVFSEVRLNSGQPFLETVAETLPVNAGSTPKVAGRWLDGEMGH